MSSIVWEGNKLIQRVGSDSDELGFVGVDESSGKYVLWLNDTIGVYARKPGEPVYIRGEEFRSLEDARENALNSPAATIMHMLWLRNGIRQAVREALEENWDRISPELGNNASKDTLLDAADVTIQQAPKTLLKRVAGLVESIGNMAQSGTRVLELLKSLGLI